MYSVIIALAISGATAVSVRSPTNYSLSRLLSRQSGGIDPSTIPPQCQSTCGPLVTDLQTCQTNACVCTNTVRGHFQDCMNCFISASSGNPTIANAATTAASQYVSACKAAGQPVAPLSFSGAAGGASTAVSGASSGVDPQPTGSVGAPLASGSGANSLPAASFSAGGGPSATADLPSATATGFGGASNTGTLGQQGSSGASPTDASSGGSGGGSAPLAGAAAVGASAHAGLTIGAMALGAVAALW